MPAELLLADYRPRSALVVPEHPIARPRYPVIDAHNHLGVSFGQAEPALPAAELLARMDALAIEVIVDLDGGWGEDVLDRHMAHYRAAAPERFVFFGGVPWQAWPTRPRDFGAYAADRLEAQVERGARGLKVWKNLGLTLRDPEGRLVPVDDERLDPLWEHAGALGVPVLIHIADPVAFFQPLDAENERYEELAGNPDWHFYGPEFPPFDALVEGLARVVERHPRTSFIGAHVGCYPENLAWVGALLDRCPNLSVDIAARIAELGRQPYTARAFFLRYADRILFGTDILPDAAWLAIHYRFLETWDEHFDYVPQGLQPGQGRWRIYGLGLPEEVLRKVYRENAVRVLGL